MKIEYDEMADAVYVHLSSKKQRIDKSREVESGIVLDLDKEKKLIGIEILDFSKRFSPSESFQFSVRHAQRKEMG